LESSPCKTYQTASYFTALTSTTKKCFQSKNKEYCKIIQWIFLLKHYNHSLLHSFNQSKNRDNRKITQTVLATDFFTYFLVFGGLKYYFAEKKRDAQKQAFFRVFAHF
jgi:hypothetical protein